MMQWDAWVPPLIQRNTSLILWDASPIDSGNPIMEIRRSHDRLISIMGFPIPVRWHLYIESGPWLPRLFMHSGEVATAYATNAVPRYHKNEASLVPFTLVTTIDIPMQAFVLQTRLLYGLVTPENWLNRPNLGFSFVSVVNLFNYSVMVGQIPTKISKWIREYLMKLLYN